MVIRIRNFKLGFAISKFRSSMGRKEKPKAKEANGDLNGGSTPPFVFSSDDDEANQDLSLKIVEKAIRMRTAKLASNDTVSNGGGGGGVVLPSQQSELAAALSDGVLDRPSVIAGSQVKEKKKKKKTVLTVESGDQGVCLVSCLTFHCFDEIALVFFWLLLFSLKLNFV